MASVNSDFIAQLYLVEKKSIPEIANSINSNYSATRSALIKSGVQLRTRAEGVRNCPLIGRHLIGKKRVFTDEWKSNISASKRKQAIITAAGVSHKTNGYSEVTIGENKGRGVHVVLMESIIGRRLNKNEVVHHKDENKQNNSIENLELMSRSDHTKLHRKIRKEKQNGER